MAYLLDSDILKEATMAAELKVIPVPPDSELAEIVDQAAYAPIVLERDGRRFRLVRDDEPEPLPSYDPERARAALKRVAGLFAGVDTEVLKAELREQRGQDSQGRPGL